MPHVSLRISRTITSVAQSAPVFVVTSDSTARRAPSPPTLSPPPCAVPRAALWHMLPRNPYRIELADIRQGSFPTSAGRSVGYDPRPPPHLTTLATQRDPHPPFPRFLQHKRPQLIQLQHRALDLHQRLRKFRQISYFCLIQPVTVLRETPKVRDSPRRLLRSS